MNPADGVVTWLGERPSGTTALLREVCDHVAGDAKGGRALLHDLQVLGAVDVDDGRYAAVPPTLSLLADGGGHSLLLGSRPRWLDDLVNDVLEGAPGLEQLSTELVDELRIPHDGAYPDTRLLSFGVGAPVEVLEARGVLVRKDVAGVLLRWLEEARPWERVLTVRPGELTGRLCGVSGNGSREWRPTSTDRGSGVFEYVRNTHQRVHATRRGEQWVEQDWRWAVWVEGLVPGRFVHDVSERQLLVKGPLRLPPLLERVLVLRTGRLPRVDGEGTTYNNITVDIADRVGALVSRGTNLA